MCVEIQIDQEWLETQGDLARAIGLEAIVRRSPHPPSLDPEDCLCGVDLEATADRIGRVVAWDECFLTCRFVPRDAI